MNYKPQFLHFCHYLILAFFLMVSVTSCKKDNDPVLPEEHQRIIAERPQINSPFYFQVYSGFYNSWITFESECPLIIDSANSLIVNKFQDSTSSLLFCIKESSPITDSLLYSMPGKTYRTDVSSPNDSVKVYIEMIIGDDLWTTNYMQNWITSLDTFNINNVIQYGEIGNKKSYIIEGEFSCEMRTINENYIITGGLGPGTFAIQVLIP